MRRAPVARSSMFARPVRTARGEYRGARGRGSGLRGLHRVVAPAVVVVWLRRRWRRRRCLVIRSSRGSRWRRRGGGGGGGGTAGPRHHHQPPDPQTEVKEDQAESRTDEGEADEFLCAVARRDKRGLSVGELFFFLQIMRCDMMRCGWGLLFFFFSFLFATREKSEEVSKLTKKKEIQPMMAQQTSWVDTSVWNWDWKACASQVIVVDSSVGILFMAFLGGGRGGDYVCTSTE